MRKIIIRIIKKNISTGKIFFNGKNKKKFMIHETQFANDDEMTTYSYFTK